MKSLIIPGLGLEIGMSNIVGNYGQIIYYINRELRSNWRIPTIEEMQYIFKLSMSMEPNKILNLTPKEGTIEQFWSTTKVGANGVKILRYPDGYIGVGDRTSSSVVSNYNCRLVRNLDFLGDVLNKLNI